MNDVHGVEELLIFSRPIPAFSTGEYFRHAVSSSPRQQRWTSPQARVSRENGDPKKNGIELCFDHQHIPLSFPCVFPYRLLQPYFAAGEKLQQYAINWEYLLRSNAGQTLQMEGQLAINRKQAQLLVHKPHSTSFDVLLANALLHIFNSEDEYGLGEQTPAQFLDQLTESLAVPNRDRRCRYHVELNVRLHEGETVYLSVDNKEGITVAGLQPEY